MTTTNPLFVIPDGVTFKDYVATLSTRDRNRLFGKVMSEAGISHMSLISNHNIISLRLNTSNLRNNLSQ